MVARRVIPIVLHQRLCFTFWLVKAREDVRYLRQVAGLGLAQMDDRRNCAQCVSREKSLPKPQVSWVQPMASRKSQRKPRINKVPFTGKSGAFLVTRDRQALLDLSSVAITSLDPAADTTKPISKPTYCCCVDFFTACSIPGPTTNVSAPVLFQRSEDLVKSHATVM